MPTATMALSSPPPSTVTMTSAARIPGNASLTSIRRMSTPSSSLHRPTLRALRERLEAMVNALPDGRAPPLAEGGDGDPAQKTYFESTASARADDRAALFRRALAACPSGASLGGSISHTLVEHGVANTRGLLRRERRTRVAAQFVGAL